MLKNPGYIIVEESVFHEIEDCKSLLPIGWITLDIRLMIITETSQRMSNKSLVVAKMDLGE